MIVVIHEFFDLFKKKLVAAGGLLTKSSLI